MGVFFEKDFVDHEFAGIGVQFDEFAEGLHNFRGEGILGSSGGGQERGGVIYIAGAFEGFSPFFDGFV